MRYTFGVGISLCAAIVGAWLVAEPGPGPSRDPAFANQVWVNRMPKDERDRIRMLIPVREGNESFGAAHDSSRFSIRAEIFTFRRDGDQLDLRFLQTRQEVRLKMRTWRCEGKAPKPFQLCLELARGQEKILLYSRDDWKLGDAAVPLAVEPPAAPGDTCADCTAPAEWWFGASP